MLARVADTVHYHFKLESGDRLEFEVDLHRSLAASSVDAHPAWTVLTFNQCRNCPLKEAACRHCPAAVDVEQIAARFGKIGSFERARIEVETPERTYVKESDAQTGLRSLLGLVMATSACPILSQFRGLASLHLPFATMKETLFRTAGAYLLSQYFTHKSGGTPDLDLRGLDHFYKQLRTVNLCFRERLASASEKDANLNAIASLFYLALGVTQSLDRNLRELRKLVLPAETNEEEGSSE